MGGRAWGSGIRVREFELFWAGLFDLIDVL